MNGWLSEWIILILLIIIIKKKHIGGLVSVVSLLATAEEDRSQV